MCDDGSNLNRLGTPDLIGKYPFLIIALCLKW